MCVYTGSYLNIFLTVDHGKEKLKAFLFRSLLPLKFKRIFAAFLCSFEGENEQKVFIFKEELLVPTASNFRLY